MRSWELLLVLRIGENPLRNAPDPGLTVGFSQVHVLGFICGPRCHHRCRVPLLARYQGQQEHRRRDYLLPHPSVLGWDECIWDPGMIWPPPARGSLELTCQGLWLDRGVFWQRQDCDAHHNHNHTHCNQRQR